MTLLRALREPRDLTDTMEIVDGQRVWHFDKPYPFVIAIAERYCGGRREDAPRFEDLGYRAVERMAELRATRYVRPLGLWLCHKVLALCHASFWACLRWLYRRGLIRLACHAGERPRVWHIRPWPMKGRGHA